jgi:hypothetical protein
MEWQRQAVNELGRALALALRPAAALKDSFESSQDGVFIILARVLNAFLCLASSFFFFSVGITSSLLQGFLLPVVSSAIFPAPAPANPAGTAAPCASPIEALGPHPGCKTKITSILLMTDVANNNKNSSRTNQILPFKSTKLCKTYIGWLEKKNNRPDFALQRQGNL